MRPRKDVALCGLGTAAVAELEYVLGVRSPLVRAVRFREADDFMRLCAAPYCFVIVVAHASARQAQVAMLARLAGHVPTLLVVRDGRLPDTSPCTMSARWDMGEIVGKIETLCKRKRGPKKRVAPVDQAGNGHVIRLGFPAQGVA